MPTNGKFIGAALTCLILVFVLLLPKAFADRPVLKWLYQNKLQKMTDNENAKYTLGPNDRKYSLKWKGVERVYYTHVPASYNSSAPTPLVLIFHGGGGSPWSVKRESLMDAKSDSAGFIAVYPSAPENVRKWNTGKRVNALRDQSNADDIGFVNAVLDQIEKEYNIDQNRIYATGISNGGMMTYGLACQDSNRIAAVAPVATTMMNYPCNPTRALSVMHFHGKKDPLVPFNGGPGDISLPKQIRLLDNLRPVPDDIAYWVQQNGCPTTPQVTYQGEVTCFTYGPGRDGSEVTLCTVENGGHTWPGGGTGMREAWYNNIVGHVTMDISANDAMWDFFQKHPKK